MRKLNSIIGAVAIAAGSAILGYTLGVSEEKSLNAKNATAPTTTLEFKYINKDNITDFIVNDATYGLQFVLLGIKGGYEICDVTKINSQEWAYSKNDEGYYVVNPEDFLPHQDPNPNPYGIRSGNKY